MSTSLSTTDFLLPDPPIFLNADLFAVARRLDRFYRLSQALDDSDESSVTE
jgi:hypothetical protein